MKNLRLMCGRKYRDTRYIVDFSIVGIKTVQNTNLNLIPL